MADEALIDMRLTTILALTHQAVLEVLRSSGRPIYTALPPAALVTAAWETIALASLAGAGEAAETGGCPGSQRRRLAAALSALRAIETPP